MLSTNLNFYLAQMNILGEKMPSFFLFSFVSCLHFVCKVRQGTASHLPVFQHPSFCHSVQVATPSGTLSLYRPQSNQSRMKIALGPDHSVVTYFSFEKSRVKVRSCHYLISPGVTTIDFPFIITLTYIQ